MPVYRLRSYLIVVNEGNPYAWTGVTALELDDALSIIRSELYRNRDDEDLAMTSVIEVSKMADIDQEHIARNMGLMLKRGIWYPNLGMRIRYDL